MRLALLSLAALCAQGATWYVSPTGNDAAACTSTGTACLSLQGAIAKASAGDTVSVATGTYSAQTITATKTSPGVSVQCATDYACIITTNISAGGAWYTIQGFKIDSGTSTHGQGYSISGSHITFQRVKAYGRYVSGWIQDGTSDFLWDGGEWGDPADLGLRNCANSDGYYLYMLGDTSIANVTLRGITANPQKLDATPCAGDPLHMESIRADGNITTMLLDRMIFLDGGQNNTGTIFITTFRGTPSGITIQNSYLGTDGNPSIVFSGTSNNITIRYNTIANGISFAAGTPTSLAITGNAGWWQSYAGCVGTHTKNVWQWDSSFSCGTDTIVIGPQFSLSNLGLTGGYTVSAGSPLINAGESTCAAVPKDIRGYIRPASGTACDAGAYEFAATIGNTCTTTATGTNWSSVSHWTSCGGTTPQPNDVAIVANTTTMDISADIGSSPASGIVDNTTSALQINAAFTVSPAVTLRVRGHVHQGNAPVVFQGGSSLVFDATSAASPSTTKYMWYADTFSAGSRSLTFSGVVGNKVNVSSQAGGGNGWFADKSGYTNGININATYAIFTRIGDSTNPSIRLASADPNTFVQALDHCRFDATGLFRVQTINMTSGGGYSLTNNTWVNSVGLPNGDGVTGHALVVSIGGTTNNVPGTHTWRGNVTDGIVLNTVSGATVVEDNIYLAGQYWAAASSSALSSYARNFIHMPDKSYAKNEAGDTVNNYYIHTVKESSQVWTGTYVSHVNSGNQMVITVSGPTMTSASMQSNGTDNWDLHLESGAGVDEVRSVRTNGTNTITVDGRWRSGKAPSSGDTISIYYGKGGNIHWFVSNTYLTSWLVDGAIIDLQNSDNNGDWGAKPSGSPNGHCATTVQNSIFLPNAQRSNASPMFVTLGDNSGVGYPDYYVNLIRNTGFAGGQSCGHVGEQGTGHADQWHEVRDNICYTDPGVINNMMVGGSSTVPQPTYWLSDWVAGSYTPADYSVNLSGTHHNATWGLAAGANGGGYGLHPTTAVYNSTDVSADPQFLDDERNIFKWGKSLGITGTRTHVINAVLAAMAKRNDDDFDSRFTLAALQAYVRAGFAPQNSALMASSTGGWIGAVDGGSPPPPPPSRSTICNRCTLSGGASIKVQ